MVATEQPFQRIVSLATFVGFTIFGSKSLKRPLIGYGLEIVYVLYRPYAGLPSPHNLMQHRAAKGSQSDADHQPRLPLRLNFDRSVNLRQMPLEHAEGQNCPG